MLVEMQSTLTGIVRVKEMDVTYDQFNRLDQGELIQNVMSHLTPDEREFLITGITKEEWDFYLSGGDSYA